MQQTRSWFQSGSLAQSFLTALAIGAAVASLTLPPIHRQRLYTGTLQLVVTTFLVTMVLEQRRKRTIRRTLDLAFLNHHVRNALAQISMSEYVSDIEQHKQLLDAAVSRISETLFRVANSTDLTGLSLEHDLSGVGLIKESEEREK
jgi:hypothetical protein